MERQREEKISQLWSQEEEDLQKFKVRDNHTNDPHEICTELHTIPGQVADTQLLGTYLHFLSRGNPEKTGDDLGLYISY